MLTFPTFPPLFNEGWLANSRQALASVSLLLACAGYLLRSAKRRAKLPPGPPGVPLLGNIYDIPPDDFWLKYMEWSKTYDSDVISLNLAGTTVVILNSLKAAKELLEQRSAIYSSRPYMPMMNELVGFSWHFGFMEYGDEWKERRSMFTRVFHPAKTYVHRPAIQEGVQKLLQQLVDHPKSFMEHVRLTQGSFILRAAYGIKVEADDDVYIKQAEHGMSAMAAAGTATSYLVDFIPLLRHVPAWFPGASFQREAMAWKKSVLAMAESPLQYVKHALSTGVSDDSAAATLLGEVENEADEVVVRDTLAAVYAAGSDTGVSAFGTFILAMVLNPDAQKKAQSAIDAAISLDDGLPDFSLFGKIPYIDAMVREVFRWRPVTPIAVPHAVIQDDVYNGYLIPAGATVIPNCWSMLHDTELYGPNTAKFDPSRFLDETETRINADMPLGLESFGFGRRVCPGIHIITEELWLAIVSVLAVFDLKSPDDLTNEERGNLGRYTTGMLIHPHPFRCQFVLRSETALKAIRDGHM
ncbi:cytochrome P450 [Coprinopsis sp. MPI-PUGE-AT-0042]|nr:cytochrome P450 [Coprinopsis sp. MPI-PUGE-AT-0042]